MAVRIPALLDSKDQVVSGFEVSVSDPPRAHAQTQNARRRSLNLFHIPFAGFRQPGQCH